ncbi:MAG: hypothetical protein RIM99_08330 [Cyclobacteriaceae bacterium]
MANENHSIGHWLKDEINTHLAIFATLLLGTWGLVVSYNVLKQQNTQVVSFEEFLSELRDSLQRLKQKADLDQDRTWKVTLYDYHPLIGNFSSQKKFGEFSKQLFEVINTPNITFQFLTYHQDILTTFFKKLSIDDDFKIVSNSYNPVHFITNVERKPIDGRPRNATIWKSSHVSEFHFVIIEDEAFQYVVLPQPTGINEIYGIKSEDPFTINYLLKSFEEKVSSVISIESVRNEGNLYKIYFEPQSNIELIVIFDSDGQKTTTREFIYTHDGDIKGFEIDRAVLESLKFPIQYEAHKITDNIIAKSKPIFYREIFEARPKDQFFRYIIPPYDCQKKKELEYCYRELEQFISEHENKILSINIFFDPSSYEIKALTAKFDKLISIYPSCFLCQIPEKSIAIEILSLTKESHVFADYESDFGIKRAVANFNGTKQFVYAAQSNSSDVLKENVEKTYEGLYKFIAKDGIQPQNIIRKWNYIGDITKLDGKDDHYNIFCGVRSHYYRELTEIDYPAATGIGFSPKNGFLTDSNDFAVKAIAFSSDCGSTLKSTVQKLPFKYSKNVLNGDNVPMFQRGKRILIDGFSPFTYISGTSAIVGEDSYKPEDIKDQVEKTIESLFDLLNPNNTHGSRKDDKIISLRNLSYIKIYYSGKGKDDLKILKTYLGPIIKDTPHIFLRTEMCRTSLNVEIEGAIL